MTKNVVTEQKLGFRRHSFQPVKSSLSIFVAEDDLLMITTTDRCEGKDLGTLWINL